MDPVLPHSPLLKITATIEMTLWMSLKFTSNSINTWGYRALV